MGTPAGWVGEAADAASKRRTAVVDRMEQIVAGVAATRSGLMRAADERHYLLGFDSGGDGRAIVAKGNPDTADNVATFVPGTGADLAGPTPSHNTVIGHSYGSTVIGHTGRDLDLNVDKMVFVGSPGVGVDDAGQLNHNPADVWATTAREDVIHETPEFIHGNHPIDPDFGANTFQSDPGKGDWIWENVETHSAYWEDGNKSLTNMGHLIVGNTEKVTR